MSHGPQQQPQRLRGSAVGRLRHASHRMRRSIAPCQPTIVTTEARGNNMASMLKATRSKEMSARFTGDPVSPGTRRAQLHRINSSSVATVISGIWSHRCTPEQTSCENTALSLSNNVALKRSNSTILLHTADWLYWNTISLGQNI